MGNGDLTGSLDDEEPSALQLYMYLGEQHGSIERGGVFSGVSLELFLVCFEAGDPSLVPLDDPREQANLFGVLHSELYALLAKLSGLDLELLLVCFKVSDPALSRPKCLAFASQALCFAC